MKDIVINKKRQRRELWVVAGCLIAAYGLNVFSIIHWNRPASEYYMTLGYVIAIALVIYIVSVIIRLLIFLCIKGVKHFVKH